MSATSDTTLSLPLGGSGANNLIDCEPCNSIEKLKSPTIPTAPQAGLAMTA